MIKLPDFNKTFEYENNFYLSCQTSRIGKMLAQYELYKMIYKLRGTIVECGVFKGASLLRFAMFRELLEKGFANKIIAFDTFDKFPETKFSKDKKLRAKFIHTAGEESISKHQITNILKRKCIQRFVKLVEGDINKTVPLYVKLHPKLRISLLNLDTDIYEPSATILEYLYPKIIKGGILILDDYGSFPGETKAVKDYFKNAGVKINQHPFCTTLSYIIKQS